MGEPDARRGVEPTLRPRVRDDVVSVEVDGERVVLDELTGHLFRFDAVGAVVWSFLDGEATVGELAADFAEAFGEDPGTVEADLLALVEQLQEIGLLEGGRAVEAEPPSDEAPRWVDPPST